MLDIAADLSDAQAKSKPHGVLIVVVGPSGAGKDSLIGFVRQRLGADPVFLFVRRIVTRPTDGATEDHDTLTPDAFAAATSQGQFAVTWEAHGLYYGIPASAADHVKAGGVAIANGSRAALPAISNAFYQIAVVHVTARPDVLARRLAGRGREDAQSIEARLRRNLPEMEKNGTWIEIDNSGDLETAGEALLSTIRRIKQSAG